MRRLLNIRSKDSATKASKEANTSSVATEAATAAEQGLQVLSAGVDPVVDVVAVHGLNGHPKKTWTANNGVNWLRDLLPHDLPRARVYSWGYDANTHSSSRVSCQYLYDHARTLVSDLCLERQITQTSERPIIFVAHSLGGIVVKSALIHSDAARRGALEEHRSIKMSTYGVIFMGTPHQGGSGVSLGKLMVNIASVFVAADDRLMRHLEQDSEWLQQQLGQYGPISGDFVTKFAFEEYKTPTVLGHSVMVVPRASAVVPGATDSEPIAIHADHTSMVRYGSTSDTGYKTVSGHLRVMAARAADTITKRWEMDSKMEAFRSGNHAVSFAVQFSLPEVFAVEHFVGRDEELDVIHKSLRYNGDRKTVIVHGLGGMGKTQLALAYAERHRETYSAVFWVNSKDIDTIKQGYAAAARRIYRDNPSQTQLLSVVEDGNLEEAMKVVKEWLSRPQNKHWLIICDNHDTPKLPGCDDTGTFDIRLFLPEAHQGAVLITTRSSQFRLGRLVALKKLENIEHSLEILSHVSGRQQLMNDPDACVLVNELDGLPLALATAGAYLYQVSTSVAEYLDLYKQYWLRIQQKTPRLLSYEDRALYSTWNISLDNVKLRSELAAKLLQLWAYFDKEDIWFELLEKGRDDGPEWFLKLTEDKLSFEEAMRVLCDHALIEADVNSSNNLAESRGYSMHTCVHSWTINVVNKTWNTDLAMLATNCVGMHVPGKETGRRWIIEQRLIPHANRCMHLVDTMLLEQHDYLPIVDALRNIGRLFKQQSKLREAERMYQLALEKQEAVLESDHPLTLTILRNLAYLYIYQNKLKKAEEMCWRALEGRERMYGPDHDATIDVFRDLGSVYEKQNRFKEAQEVYNRALERTQESFGPDHKSTLTLVNMIGLLYVRWGKLEEAETMLEWALKGKKRAYGPDSVPVFGTMLNLGMLYKRQNKLVEAEEVYLKVLEGFLHAYGPDHIFTLRTKSNIGNIYSIQNRVDEAEEMYKQAIEGKKKTLGSSHRSTLSTMKSLGSIYEEKGELDKATSTYQEVLKESEGSLGYHHDECVRLRCDLARLAELQRNGREQ